MFEYIKKLQGRSVEERNKVALTVAGFLTVIIFLIWLSTFSFQKGEPETKTEAIDLAPVENIKSAIGDFYSSFKDVGDAVKKAKEIPLGTTTETVATTTTSTTIN